MILIDILLILSVCGGLFYMYRLRRAISVVHESRGELKQLMAQFAFDINRAEKALNELKQAGKQQVSELQQSGKKALNLHDDLEFLMHRGEDIADRLETLSHQGSKKVQSGEKKISQKKVKPKMMSDLRGLR